VLLYQLLIQSLVSLQLPTECLSAWSLHLRFFSLHLQLLSLHLWFFSLHLWLLFFNILYLRSQLFYVLFKFNYILCQLLDVSIESLCLIVFDSELVLQSEYFLSRLLVLSGCFERVLYSWFKLFLYLPLFTQLLLQLTYYRLKLLTLFI